MEHNELGAKHIFYALVLFACAGCVSCSMGGKRSETSMVEDMADNCKHGLKRAEVEQDSDDHTVKIECADPPRYGIDSRVLHASSRR